MTYQSNSLMACLIVLSSLLTSGCQQPSNTSSGQKSVVTLDGFEKIGEGMSMEQVTSILGPPQAGTGANDGKAGMTLVGVDVSQLARWGDDAGDGTRQIEVGFADGKVAAVVYRDGDVVKMKPAAPAGSFRLLAEFKSARTMRVVVDTGASQECVLALGVDEAPNQLKGLEATTTLKTTIFAVSGQVVDNLDGGGKSLEIVLECLDPQSNFIVKFAIDQDASLADALAFDCKSGVYELGEPVVVGIVSAQDGKEHKIILHVSEEMEPKESV